MSASSVSSLIQSLAPWRRLLCCFGLNQFRAVPNAASVASVDLVRSFENPTLRMKAAIGVTMAHILGPDLFRRMVCQRCGFAKLDPYLGIGNRPI